MTGKQLKNSILQWAIQGKLVPQDSNDEPASVLLEKIRQEKERLIKEKKIKRDKNASIIYRGEDNSYYEKILATGEVKCIDEEIPFEVPEGWEWERWGNISLSIQYGYNAPALPSGTIKMVRISDIQNNDVKWDTVPYCKIAESEIDNYVLRSRDILFARTGGTVGKSFLVEKVQEQAIYAGYLIRTQYSELLIPEYLKYFMESQLYWEQLRNGTIATAQPNCNGQTLSKMILPIPPQTEQMRIISKIKELMPLIGKYGRLDDELYKLNSTLNEYLKKSILQEAIQGKLVPQIAEEGTAQELLEAIKTEKQRLVKEGKLKKSALIDSVIYKGDDNKYWEKIGDKEVCIEDEIPFEIPEGWSFSRLSSIAEIYTGNSINENEKKRLYSGVKGREYIATKDVGFNSHVDYENGIAIPPQYQDSFRLAPKGSVLLCIEGGSAGRKIAILDRDVHFGNKLCCFSPYADLSRFIFYYLQSPSFYEIFTNGKTGIIGGVSVNNIKKLIIPIPPRSEIHRITECLDKAIASIMSR